AEPIKVAAVSHVLMSAISGDKKSHPVTGLALLFVIGRALNHHLRRLHLDSIVRREQHFALKLSFVEMEKQISAHVGNVAVDLSRRTDGATIRTLLVKRNPLHFRLHVKSLDRKSV